MPIHRFHRDTRYPVDDILPLLKDPRATQGRVARIDIDGDLINIASLRLYTFKVKGIACVWCGARGTHFIKEKSGNNDVYHFNLYAVNAHGAEVLMTKDHIIPRCAGGPDRLENMQPMCAKCNNRKCKYDAIVALLTFLGVIKYV